MQINFDEYTKKLQQEVQMHLSSLRIVLCAIDDKTYLERANKSASKRLFNLDVGSPGADVFRQLEIHKFLKSIISSLQDHIDILISIEVMKNSEVPVFGRMTKTEMRDAYFIFFKEKLREISMNQDLRVPDKLKSVFKDSDDDIKIAQSYFDIRNGLEHHKGIAKKGIKLKYRTVQLEEGGRILTNDNSKVEANKIINVRLVEKEVVFDRHDQMFFSYEDVEDMAFTILNFIAPQMFKALLSSMSK